MGSAHFLECSNQQFKTVAGIVERPEREVGKLHSLFFRFGFPNKFLCVCGSDFRFLFRLFCRLRSVCGLFYLAVKIIRPVP